MIFLHRQNVCNTLKQNSHMLHVLTSLCLFKFYVSSLLSLSIISNTVHLQWRVASSLCLLCPFSSERRPLPWASPDSPWLHGPDHLWPRWRTAPSPTCPHAHGDPLRPPPPRLHHRFAALTHGHPISRLSSGPPRVQTTGGWPPSHSLTGWGSRARGGRGWWVLVFQTSRSEEAKASDTAYNWDSQTMRVCVRGLSGRAPLPKAGKN